MKTVAKADALAGDALQAPHGGSDHAAGASRARAAAVAGARAACEAAGEAGGARLALSAHGVAAPHAEGRGLDGRCL